MKQIVFARIDDRLIHGQVMTAWLKQCDANEVVIIDNELCKDTFVVMMMKSLIPSTISLKVFNDADAASYLKVDGKGEKILILVKTPQAVLTLMNNGITLEYLNIGGMGMKAGRSKLYKNIAASDEEREVFRELLNRELVMKVQVVPTEKAEDLGKYL
ncbi:PTS mannose/fructose/sorbose transporter subunit IIB [Erysipelotrichaceae bacterium AF15-26LB]|jgi:mannose/fructose/N-acetylgalactosamine-specific phosphotransferase system component IIB|nr:PTS system sorbose subfamily IIB component [Erysipelotrichaceae bacterium 3_1_53]MCR0346820.1 PTS sugar transporter subunit IIB [[Clostridium] innocuum]RJV92236.1 PTS mannose/fructose/sorbose transporter subunit IIB [Erysipelotrichaceae bacterium AF19-24AC]RJV93115.1 PTS mannose/fructose/sorbose transporter subunit IIB [Erysipelotrichaceae bacterium AF15-26LB]